jgi:hypothetical protein
LRQIGGPALYELQIEPPTAPSWRPLRLENLKLDGAAGGRLAGWLE